MKMRFAVMVSLLVAALAAAAGADLVCRPLHPNPEALAARIAAEGELHPMMQAATYAETQLDVVDILIAFDQSAVRWIAANGKGTPSQYAASCIDKLNYCLEQSHVREYFHFRLAGTVVLASDLSKTSLITVVQSLIDEYGRVVSSGEWKKVTDARASLGADIVTVMTDCGATGNVGQGYSLESDWGGRSGAAIKAFGDWAYNACAIQAVDSGYTQMHEVGHNMGCGHPDDEMSPGLASISTLGYKATGPQFYDYSSGWYLWDAGTGYYTVMSYNWGGVGPDGVYKSSLRFQPLPFFSNPVYKWRGHALGDAKHDNRRTLINTFKYVAQYRVSMLPAENPTGASATPGRSGSLVSEEPAEPASGMVLVKAVEVGGCVQEGDGRAIASVSFKFGKTGRKGTKVSCSVTPFATGRRTNSKSVTVDLSQGPRTLSFELKVLGTLTVTVGRDSAGAVAFSGVIAGKMVSSAGVGGAPVGTKAFSRPAVPEVVKGVKVNVDYLPDGEPVFMQGRKWVLGKAASISYKTDRATGVKRWFVNNGKDDPNRTNLSDLRLVYKVKDGSFKGSFTIYGLYNDKLKRVKADVRGLVIDGEGRGAAVVKGQSETWPVEIR